MFAYIFSDRIPNASVAFIYSILNFSLNVHDEKLCKRILMVLKLPLSFSFTSLIPEILWIVNCTTISYFTLRLSKLVFIVNSAQNVMVTYNIPYG